MFLPKSKYTGPLYTPEGVYVYEDGSPFSGAFFITYDNKAYEGTGPAKAGSRIILKAVYLAQQAAMDLGKVSIYFPSPTDQDYERGTIKRYFVKDRRNSMIKEVDQVTFKKLRVVPVFTRLQITWKIIGPVADSKLNSYIVPGTEGINKKTVEDAEVQMRGIISYITDYTEFVK